MSAVGPVGKKQSMADRVNMLRHSQLVSLGITNLLQFEIMPAAKLTRQSCAVSD